MMRCCASLCSSGCFRRKGYDSDESDDEGEQQTKLEDLMLTPNKIDSNLERNIAEWQEAINEYKLYEDTFLELNDPRDDLQTIIKALRKKPNVFLASTYSVNVRKLAEKKVAINKMQKKLGLSKEMQAALLDSEVDVVPVSNYDNGGGNNSIVSNPLNASIIMRDSSINVSTKISVMWANRLNEINPTQGALHLQGEEEEEEEEEGGGGGGGGATAGPSLNRSPSLKARPAPLVKHASMDVKIRPKWPDFLVDISYDVVKVNRFGHQMRRTLKLTQNHVINIKNGCVISKFYHFNDIRRTWLEGGNTIKVQQRNDKQNIYRSPIAAHILQQIITRVQVRASLDRTEFSTSGQHIDRSALISTGIHSSAAIAAIIKNIAEENTLETEAVMATFANDLKQRTVRTVSTDLRGSESSSSKREEDEEPATREAADEQEEGLKGTTPSEQSSQLTSDDPSQSSLQAVMESVHEITSEATEKAVLHLENLLDPSQQLSDLVLRFSESPTKEAVSRVNELQLTKEEQQAHENNDSSVTDTAAGAAEENHETQEVRAEDRPGSASSNGGGNHGASSRHNSLSNKRSNPARDRTTSGMSTGSSSTAASSPTPSAAPRFLNFKEGMPEFSAQKAVQNVIFDDSTSEGNTRKLFIDKFILESSTACSPEGCKAKLLEVRLFIDGMHEYLLTHRGISLALLYEQEKQRMIINSNSNKEEGSGGAAGAGSSVLKESEKQQAQRQLTKRKSLQFLKDNMDLSVVEDSVLVFISFIIFIVVEEALFLPLRNILISYLPGGGRMEEEQQLVTRMKAFSSRTQQQWGVPSDLVSPLGWQSAAFELAGVEHNLTPSSQLHILTRTIKAIYNEFKLVVLPRLEAAGKHDVYIGADDLVPIFLFVFCHSNLKHPIRNRDLMWSLCHPDQLHGEGGYYLTVYESAIEFVLNEPLSSESFLQAMNSNNNSSSNGGTAGGSRSSLTNNPLHFSNHSAMELEDNNTVASSDSKQSRRMTKMTSREKFLDSLALRLRGIHHFVVGSGGGGGVLRGHGHGHSSTEDSRSRVMSGEYAMRESFY